MEGFNTLNRKHNENFPSFSTPKWKVVQGTARKWLIPICDESGTMIHCFPNERENSPGYRGFRGYGGSTLTFPLEDGTELKVQGPWHSNAESLFEDTGIDLRNTYMTFGVIARIRNNGILREILYMDSSPRIGELHRIQKIAEAMATDRNETLYYYSESRNGSVCGPTVNPEEE